LLIRTSTARWETLFACRLPSGWATGSWPLEDQVTVTMNESLGVNRER
jgi:hypothetical protein